MHHLQSLSALYLEPLITKGVVYTLVDKVGSHVVYSFRIFFFWLVGWLFCLHPRHAEVSGAGIKPH